MSSFPLLWRGTPSLQENWRPEWAMRVLFHWQWGERTRGDPGVYPQEQEQCILPPPNQQKSEQRSLLLELLPTPLGVSRGHMGNSNKGPSLSWAPGRACPGNIQEAPPPLPPASAGLWSKTACLPEQHLRVMTWLDFAFKWTTLIGHVCWGDDEKEGGFWESVTERRENQQSVVFKSQGRNQKTGKRPKVRSTAKYPDERSDTFYWIWQLDDSHWSLWFQDKMGGCSQNTELWKVNWESEQPQYRLTVSETGRKQGRKTD